MTFKIEYINGETVVACDTTDEDFRLGMAQHALRSVDALLHSLRRAYGGFGFEQVFMYTLDCAGELLDGAADALDSDRDSEQAANQIFGDEWLIGKFDEYGNVRIATGPAEVMLESRPEPESSAVNYRALYEDENGPVTATAATRQRWIEELAIHATYEIDRACKWPSSGKPLPAEKVERIVKLNSLLMTIVTNLTDEVSIAEASDLVFGKGNWSVNDETEDEALRWDELNRAAARVALADCRVGAEDDVKAGARFLSLMMKSMQSKIKGVPEGTEPAPWNYGGMALQVQRFLGAALIDAKSPDFVLGFTAALSAYLNCMFSGVGSPTDSMLTFDPVESLIEDGLCDADVSAPVAAPAERFATSVTTLKKARKAAASKREAVPA